ncbi:MAG: hypothetical protein JXR61_01745 [Prolixibacteraceae bacterium]|nr:hypothetical protein [Prolixibacteraceae bacterium]
MQLSSRVKFLLKNGIRGLVWFAIILAAYFLFNELVISKNPEVWIEPFYSRPLMIYGIYLASEFFIGIIPPEFFMIWAYNKAGTIAYILNIGFFAIVSYGMGYLTFLIGQYLYKRVSFRYFRKKFLNKQVPLLKKYGLFLIIIAALTPLPWSAVCLLVGSAGYPTTKFLKYALFRILRFIVYGFIIFQTHQI